METPWFPFVERADRTAEVAFLMLPFAGGAATAARDWQAKLGARFQVLAAELPGRGTRLREAPLTEIEQVLEGLQPALELVRAGRPLAVFGHSFGAFLAFELARRLDAPPIACFVSGARAPDAPGREPALHQLDEDGLVAALAELGGTPPEVLGDRDLMGLFLPALRADLRMAERFSMRARPGLAIPLHVLGGERDRYAEPAAVGRWLEFAAGARSFRGFPGGHFFAFEDPDVVGHVVQQLRR